MSAAAVTSCFVASTVNVDPPNRGRDRCCAVAGPRPDSLGRVTSAGASGGHRAPDCDLDSANYRAPPELISVASAALRRRPDHTSEPGQPSIQTTLDRARIAEPGPRRSVQTSAPSSTPMTARRSCSSGTDSAAPTHRGAGQVVGSVFHLSDRGPLPPPQRRRVRGEVRALRATLSDPTVG